MTKWSAERVPWARNAGSSFDDSDRNGRFQVLPAEPRRSATSATASDPACRSNSKGHGVAGQTQARVTVPSKATGECSNWPLMWFKEKPVSVNCASAWESSKRSLMPGIQAARFCKWAEPRKRAGAKFAQAALTLRSTIAEALKLLNSEGN